MNPLIFLGGALLLFLLFSVVSWLRHRERSVTFESSIERFRHEMGALAPDDDEQPERRP